MEKKQKLGMIAGVSIAALAGLAQLSPDVREWEKDTKNGIIAWIVSGITKKINQQAVNRGNAERFRKGANKVHEGNGDANYANEDYLWAARDYEKAGETEKAQEVYREALEKEMAEAEEKGTDPRPWTLIEIYEALGEEDKLAEVKRAKKVKDAGWAKEYENYASAAELYDELEMPKEAAECRRLARYQEAEIAMEERMYEAAAAIYEELEEPNKAQIAYIEAYHQEWGVKVRTPDFNKARELAEKAEIDPSDVEERVREYEREERKRDAEWRADCRKRNKEERKKAREHYRREEYEKAGDVYYSVDNWWGAHDAWERAVEKYVAEGEFYDAAMVSAKLGEHRQSWEYYALAGDQALEEHKFSYAGRCYWSAGFDNLVENLEKIDTAKRAYAEELAQSEDVADREKAAKLFDDVNGGGKESRSIYEELAREHEEAGENRQAIRYYKLARMDREAARLHADEAERMVRPGERQDCESGFEQAKKARGIKESSDETRERAGDLIREAALCAMAEIFDDEWFQDRDAKSGLQMLTEAGLENPHAILADYYLARGNHRRAAELYSEGGMHEKAAGLYVEIDGVKVYDCINRGWYVDEEGPLDCLRYGSRTEVLGLIASELEMAGGR